MVVWHSLAYFQLAELGSSIIYPKRDFCMSSVVVWLSEHDNATVGLIRGMIRSWSARRLCSTAALLNSTVAQLGGLATKSGSQRPSLWDLCGIRKWRLEWEASKFCFSLNICTKWQFSWTVSCLSSTTRRRRLIGHTIMIVGGLTNDHTAGRAYIYIE